mgnify:CR=1 FL=1
MKRLSYWEVRTITLTSNGQLTVPAAICYRRSFKPGDELIVTVVDQDSFRVNRRKGVSNG